MLIVSNPAQAELIAALGFLLKGKIMAAEKINQRTVKTGSGLVKAVSAPTARQSFVPVPVGASRPAGQAATFAGNVPAILAPNARQTHLK